MLIPLDVLIVNKNIPLQVLSNIILKTIIKTKNPTNVGLFAIKKVNYLFQKDHLLGLTELSCLDRIDI